MFRRELLSAFVVFLLAVPAAARGAELAPGEVAEPPLTNYRGPRASDELIASQSGTFEFTGSDEYAGTQRVFRGGYDHSVYRDRDNGTLSFRYGASGADVDGSVVDLEGMTVSGFGTFLTDVQITGRRFVSRSNDGDTIGTQYSDSVSVGMFVRTNATAFANGGKMTYEISFQPTASGGVGVFDTFRPVPEPGAAAVAIGMTVLSMRRRRCGHRDR